jgi:hypothetical protein
MATPARPSFQVSILIAVQNAVEVSSGHVLQSDDDADRPPQRTGASQSKKVHADAEIGPPEEVGLDPT